MSSGSSIPIEHEFDEEISRDGWNGAHDLMTYTDDALMSFDFSEFMDLDGFEPETEIPQGGLMPEVPFDLTELAVPAPYPALPISSQTIDSDEAWAMEISAYIDAHKASPDPDDFAIATGDALVNSACSSGGHMTIAECDIGDTSMPDAGTSVVEVLPNPPIISGQRSKRKKRPTTAISSLRVRKPPVPGQLTQNWRASLTSAQNNSGRPRKKTEREKSNKKLLDQVGQCIRCKVDKKKCSPTLPCDNCQKSSRDGSLWRRVCIRVRVYRVDDDPNPFYIDNLLGASMLEIGSRLNVKGISAMEASLVEANSGTYGRVERALLFRARAERQRLSRFAVIVRVALSVLMKCPGDDLELEDHRDIQLQIFLHLECFARLMLEKIFGYYNGAQAEDLNRLGPEIFAASYILAHFKDLLMQGILGCMIERVETWMSKGLTSSGQALLWHTLGVVKDFFGLEKKTAKDLASTGTFASELLATQMFNPAIDFADHITNAVSCFISLANERMPKDALDLDGNMRHKFPLEESKLEFVLVELSSDLVAAMRKQFLEDFHRGE